MFVIYTPEFKDFLSAIIPSPRKPGLDWNKHITPTGIIESKEDAILMANEVQRIRAMDNIFHFGVQVLKLNPDKVPEFKSPVFELRASRFSVEGNIN